MDLLLRLAAPWRRRINSDNYLRRIGFPLNDVQNADVATRFTRCCRDHSVLWLQKSSHNVEDCGFANRFRLFYVVGGERGVGGHEEVASWGRDESCDDTDEVVVHVAGVTKGSGASGHNS